MRIVAAANESSQRRQTLSPQRVNKIVVLGPRNPSPPVPGHPTPSIPGPVHTWTNRASPQSADRGTNDIGFRTSTGVEEVVVLPSERPAAPDQEAGLLMPAGERHLESAPMDIGIGDMANRLGAVNFLPGRDGDEGRAVLGHPSGSSQANGLPLGTGT